jgi:hypothetical protein
MRFTSLGQCVVRRGVPVRVYCRLDVQVRLQKNIRLRCEWWLNTNVLHWKTYAS